MAAPGVIKWDDEKNRKLRSERGIGFEAVLEAIETGRFLADEAHPNPERDGH
jgi:uncharacterized DUF497 family protein